MIQVYTGCGKGKTTACLGLALRAAGAGLKVYIAQFLKNQPSGELAALKRIKNIRLERFGRSCFVKGRPTAKDKELAQRGLDKVKRLVGQRLYDVVILDELNAVLKLKLVSLSEVLSIMDNAPSDMELVLSGRDAPQEVIKRADLVSDIRQVKHYFRDGLKARRGIEF